MKKAKVFLSHSHKDEQIARELKLKLEQYDIETWIYECNLPFGEEIAIEIENHICECDCILIILSDFSRESFWVGRELGLVLQLQQKRGGHPIIIGLRCELPCKSFNFNYYDFWSGELNGSYDFSKVRFFNFNISQYGDSLEELAQYLIPKITFISETSGEQQRLLQASFECYEELFPDQGERDDPADIEIWLDEARRTSSTNDPWREIYAVLHVGEHVIGMAFISIHLHFEWAFGNYFGVRRGWRQLKRAENFLEEVIKHLQILSPNIKGILFEVDPIDLHLLTKVANRPKIGGYDDEKEALLNIRLLRRLQLYESYKCLAILGSDNLPLSYWQPAMDEPLDRMNERELILMVRLIKKIPTQEKDITLAEILDFIYDVLYKDAYGGAGSVDIPGYGLYVDQVKTRVKNKATYGWKIGNVKIPKKVRNIVIKAKKEKFFDELAL